MFVKKRELNSSPKTFNLNFAPMGYSTDMKRLNLSFHREYLIGAKFGLKVFGKGSGEEPFFRKVFPSKYPYYFCISTAHNSVPLFYIISPP